MEAAWRLYAEHIDGLWPPVRRLALRLKEQETVHFGDDDNLEEVLDEDKTTTLTAWFAYNQKHADGRHLTYQQFSTHFTYNEAKRVWTKRVANRASVGRMYMATPGMPCNVNAYPNGNAWSGREAPAFDLLIKR